MPIITARLAMICAAALLALGLAACGGSTTTPSSTAPAAPPAPTSGAATGSPTNGSGTDSASTSAGTKVSANTASEDEIAAALTNAGVSNPERWAEEVVEYRPYPIDDPNLTKLRDNLAKYNPGQETTDKIVSALTP
jgi:hypothetical protein